MAFPATSVLDSFSGGDENPITTNWTCPLKSGDQNLKIVSNQLLCEYQGGVGDGYYDISTFGPSCEVYATIATWPGVAGDQMCLYLRMTGVGGSTPSGYYLNLIRISTTDYLQIVRLDSGSATQIGADITPTIASGDSIGMSIVGGQLTSYHKPSAGSWTQKDTVSDGTYSSAGYLGAKIVQASASAPAFDDFGGGGLGQFLSPDADTAAGGWAAFGTASLWEATSDSSDSTYMLGTAS